MSGTEIMGIVIIILLLINLMLLLRKSSSAPDLGKWKAEMLSEMMQQHNQMLGAAKQDLAQEIRASRQEVATAMQTTAKTLVDPLVSVQKESYVRQDKRLEELNINVRTTNDMSLKSLEGIRTVVNDRLEALRKDNQQQLDKMRETVDEKLQKTLEDRITQSFKLVNDRLQEVYTGLGEMKTLANGVGDLKKVLSNVKTRGIVGEYQLKALIEELLTPEQYEENVVTKKGSTNRVEFAIKLPGDDEHAVYLPIDAKFPSDTYSQLVDAYESGDPETIATAQATLEARIKGCAKDIHDKYLDPPNTTEFAVMFLPFEGLYAEVVRKGLIDTLQRQYRVNIAGPTTFAALLNSLQMGFRTLAIQKRSGEVWQVLGAVKTEFTRFEDVLTAAQKRIEQTGAELDKLIGVRTRKINSKLREVSELPAAQSQTLLDSAPDPAE